MPLSEGDPADAHFSRLAGLLTEQTFSAPVLGELRAVVSAVISIYKSSLSKHGYLEKMLEAAAAVWNKSLSLGDLLGEDDATLKQAALDLQWTVLDAPSLPLSHQLRLSEQALQTAQIWAELGQWEAADAALGRGLSLSSALLSAATTTVPSSTETGQRDRCAIALFNSMLLRLRASLRLGQELPASALLLKLKEFSSHASLTLRQRTMFALDLLATLVFEGERLLEGGKSIVAAQMLQAAHEAHGALAAAGPELQAAGVADDADTLSTRALVLLCWAHLESGNASDRALSCVQTLQAHSQRAAASISVPLLAHRALLQAGRAQEAETELLKVVTHENSSPETCAFAIQSALQAPGGTASARAALAAAQELTSSGDISLILDLAEAVLGEHHPSSQDPPNLTKTAAFTSSADKDSAQELILELLEDEALHETVEEDISGTTKQRLHVLCWNEACTLLESDNPSQALRFYALAAAFTSTEDIEGAVGCRVSMALCSSAQGEHSTALEHLRAAESIAPGRLPTAFLRLKICLASGDEAATGEALEAFAQVDTCDADALRVVCCEAMEAGMQGAAKAALAQLLTKLQNGTGASDLSLGYESVVFQNLIQLTVNQISNEKDKEKESDADLGDQHDGSESRSFTELVQWFTFLVQRVHAMGPENFFENEKGLHRQLEWLQLTAWNSGCDAAKRGILDAATALLARCGELCSAHPAPDAATLRRGHLAFVMAAAAALDSPNPSEGSLVLAAQNLDSARSIAAILSERHPPITEQDSKAQVYSHILEFHLGVRSSNDAAAIAAVEAAQLLPAANADHFLKMAVLVGEDKVQQSGTAPKAALTAALGRLTSQPNLNYVAVAGVIRALLECCATDGDRLTILRDAASLLAAAPAGAFPPLEARYLITTAWNRGATHSKFGRMGDAEAFMGMAIHMVRAVDATAAMACEQGAVGESHGLSNDDKDKMASEYSRVQNAVNSSGDDATAVRDGHGGDTAMELGADSAWMTT